MEGQLRNFSDLNSEKFNDEKLPTISSEEQVNEIIFFC